MCVERFRVTYACRPFAPSRDPMPLAMNAETAEASAMAECKTVILNARSDLSH
jgi:hypothetical protein